LSGLRKRYADALLVANEKHRGLEPFFDGPLFAGLKSGAPTESHCVSRNSADFPAPFRARILVTTRHRGRKVF